VYHILAGRIREALAACIRSQYGLVARVSVEQPPRLELGEAASPVCFELAKQLKRAPRQIAQEIVAQLEPIAGVARWQVAGGGYVNAFLDRAAFFQMAFERAAREAIAPPAGAPKAIVEHTNINPNKAAHIGHLRNAALGDTFVRLLRHTGQRVEVQNYIDNTGVQVADVVVGFLHLEKKTPAEVRALAAQPRFDFYCWDLYARVTQFFEAQAGRERLRQDALQAIEEGRGDAAEIGRIVAEAIVRCHLRTMERLGVEYDLLPQESEILHLKFWEAAFAQLQQRGAIRLAKEGKNAGCWVMPLGADEAEEEAEAKIIVRSNGTVTYVGKDIAYQLWKFGLLDRDFRYARFHTHPSGHAVWVTTSGPGDPAAPRFGRADRVYNVIDSRQSYLQKVVVAGLRALGYHDQAERSVHFAYEMVALSPRCAAQMGYELAEEEARRAYIEVSGRRGLGVKADDLLDRLEARARAEVDKRHPDNPEEQRRQRARIIAIGALRYFLLKYSRNKVIAFDFDEALSFEGETGPYCQYAVVRARNIFRKLALQKLARHEEAPGRPMEPPGASGLGDRLPPENLARFLASPGNDDLWQLTLLAGSLGAQVEAAVAVQEPAFVAKYAFELAQAFNNFYHRHHILTESDPARQAFLLRLVSLVERQLVTALNLLGIEAPEKM